MARNEQKTTEKNMLRVRSLDKGGFRRAGMHFTPEGVEVAREDLSDEQFKAISEEPRLAVEAVA